MAKTMTDEEACKWGGFMGHTVLVVEDCGDFGRSVRLHTCDIHSATSYAREDGRRNPRIWTKAGKKWREYVFDPKGKAMEIDLDKHVRIIPH